MLTDRVRGCFHFILLPKLFNLKLILDRVDLPYRGKKSWGKFSSRKNLVTSEKL